MTIPNCRHFCSLQYRHNGVPLTFVFKLQAPVPRWHLYAFFDRIDLRKKAAHARHEAT